MKHALKSHGISSIHNTFCLAALKLAFVSSWSKIQTIASNLLSSVNSVIHRQFLGYAGVLRMKTYLLQAAKMQRLGSLILELAQETLSKCYKVMQTKFTTCFTTHFCQQSQSVAQMTSRSGSGILNPTLSRQLQSVEELASKIPTHLM